MSTALLTAWAGIESGSSSRLTRAFVSTTIRSGDVICQDSGQHILRQTARRGALRHAIAEPLTLGRVQRAEPCRKWNRLEFWPIIWSEEMS